MVKVNKKFFMVFAALICVFSMTGVSAAQQVFINIATGGTGGTYYPLGGAFADIWTHQVTGARLNVTVQTTGGSVANTNLLRHNHVEVSINQNDIAYYAKHGVVLFDTPFPEIRGAASLFSEVFQLVTDAASNINSVADLRGRRVAIGAIGSGTEACARQMLRAAGLDADVDIEARHLSFVEAVTAIRDRQIEAAIVLAGIPTGAVTDLATTNNVRITPICYDIATKLLDEYSFYVRFTIPAGTYRGQDEDVETVAVRAIITVREEFDADLLYEMLETLFDNQERIIRSHSAGRFINLETALDGMSIPLHSGAERFFRNRGLID